MVQILFLSPFRSLISFLLYFLFQQLAARWRNLTPDEKQVYLRLEAADRKRFAQEAAAADEQALAIQEARRAALQVQDGEGHASRGARKKVDEMRAKAALHKPKVLSAAAQERRAQQAAETAQRRAEKQAQEDAMQKQHTKLDKEQAKKASQRLEFLLKESSIFAKLQGGDGKTHGETAAQEAEEGKPHHLHQNGEEVQGDDEEDEEEGGEEPIFLSQQPSCIKFGTLKPYQLESLNWMIHLAGKGLNGILADGKFTD
jgi:SWI/SNF-related matrix-associated actin-dependent regulator of chromatin subfamily A member 5